MIKKILVVILSLLWVPTAFAVTATSQSYNRLYFNETDFIFPITITSDQADEITALNGINIILEPAQKILWDAVGSVSAVGSAVTGGNMDSTIIPEYLNDYKIVHLPVKTDWPAGKSVEISGLKLRAYRWVVGMSYFQYDFNGDLTGDVTDINSYMVWDTQTFTDFTPPYPLTDVKYSVSENKSSVTLTWKNPPDYDFNGVTILKFLNRAGQSQPEVILQANIINTSYTDTAVMAGDVIRYELYAKDLYAESPRSALTVNISTTDTETTPPPAVEPPPVTEKTELDQLNSLYNYYKVRYAIKCRDLSSSACLWAKIDLVYTQEKIDKSEINTSLSTHDLYLIKLRIQWSDARYQTSCVEASTPAAYCSALNKALMRAHYFID